MRLAVLLLVQVACIHTSVPVLTNPHYATVAGTGRSHGCAHTRPVWLTQNDVTPPSILGLTAATVVTSEPLQVCPIYK